MRFASSMPVWLGVITVALLTVAACGGGDDSSNQPADSGGVSDLAETGDSIFDGTQAAPEFPGGHTWFNVGEPLTLEGLRGKVVVLDFWTAGCINCQHIIPDLERLEMEFEEELVVIGVHSGKYDREQEDKGVLQAILRFGLVHPVVNDPDFVIWSAYGVSAWPTTIVINPAGNIVLGRSGEGVYDAIQPFIQDLVSYFDERGEIDRTLIAFDLEAGAVTSTFLSYPSSVLADDAGDRLFIVDGGHNRVLIADLDGSLLDVIGSGREGLEDGYFEEATLREPQGLALSPDGNTLYIADTRNHAIRAANLTTREVVTIAGTGARAQAFPAAAAPVIDTDLASPWGIVLHEGTLYMAMAGTHQIWTLDIAENSVSVFAGSGREGIQDGPRLQATLAQPSGLTTDGTSLFWVDPESSSVRRVPIDGNGDVETLVGTGLFDFGDSDGVGTGALLEHPQGIAYVDGLLYVADTYNHKVRTVDPGSGEVLTVAGAEQAGFEDGAGGESLFNEPAGLSVGDNYVYVADTSNHAVRLLDPESGDVRTLELQNLGVAAQGLEGRTLKVSLPAQEVSPSTSTLRIRLATPEGFYLNSLAPSMLTLSSSNLPALTPGDDSLEWLTDEPFIELIVPIAVMDGQAILTAEGPVFYCRKGEEAICLIENVDIALPVTVTPGASSDELLLDYVLPSPVLN
ncbi:MAG: redoxin domain-containing protein [Chloroflexi bacterium]|nr:redoxin domain-containing protein [Chloroflexota bacterium]